jgi:hypothetical protein
LFFLRRVGQTDFKHPSTNLNLEKFGRKEMDVVVSAELNISGVSALVSSQEAQYLPANTTLTHTVTFLRVSAIDSHYQDI